jgi:hypothetical protein
MIQLRNGVVANDYVNILIWIHLNIIIDGWYFK